MREILVVVVVLPMIVTADGYRDGLTLQVSNIAGDGGHMASSCDSQAIVIKPKRLSRVEYNLARAPGGGVGVANGRKPRCSQRVVYAANYSHTMCCYCKDWPGTRG